MNFPQKYKSVKFIYLPVFQQIDIDYALEGNGVYIRMYGVTKVSWCLLLTRIPEAEYFIRMGIAYWRTSLISPHTSMFLLLEASQRVILVLSRMI